MMNMIDHRTMKRPIIHTVCLLVALWPFFSEINGQNKIYKVFDRLEWQTIL